MMSRNRTMTDMTSKVTVMRQYGRRGFTLLELVVVLLIVSLLAAFVLSAMQKARTRAKRTQATVEAQSLQAAINAYHQEYEQWPCSDPSLGGSWSSNNNEVIKYLAPTHPLNTRHFPFWHTNAVAVDPLGANYVITITNQSVKVTSPNVL